MKKLIVIIMLFTVVLGCSRKTDRLIVGLIKPSLNHLPVDIGLVNKTISNSNIEIKYFSSGWETNEALVAGKIDLAIMPFTYAWTDVSKGHKVKIISTFERESDGVIANNSINDFNGLEGKKIGVLRASTLEIFASMLLKSKAINSKIVHFRTPMDLASALNSGVVDAISFYVPSIFKFSTEFKIIDWFGNHYEAHPCCDVVVNENAIETKIEQMTIFMKELKLSIGLLNSHKLLEEIAKTNFGLTKDQLHSSLEHTKFIMGLSEGAKEFEKAAVEEMINLGYIEEAVQEGDVYYEINY